MKSKLINVIACDKSRQFVDLPESVNWEVLRGHLEKMPDSVVTDYVSDGAGGDVA